MIKLKNEKGSISVIVVVTIMFFLAVASASYMINATKAKTQLKSIDSVKQTYESEFNNVDGIYAKMRGIPEEYSSIDYIESSGSQFIDTKYKPNQDTSVEAVFSFDDLTNNQAIFCARNNYQVNSFTLFNMNGTQLRYDYNTEMLNANKIEVDTKTKIYANKEKLLLNDNPACTGTYNSFQSDNTLYLLASYQTQNVNVDNYAKGKLYYVKIFENDNIIRDMKPCIRKSDNQVGLYDIATKEFYLNGGSGSFAAGNE